MRITINHTGLQKLYNFPDDQEFEVAQEAGDTLTLRNGWKIHKKHTVEVDETPSDNHPHPLGENLGTLAVEYAEEHINKPPQMIPINLPFTGFKVVDDQGNEVITPAPKKRSFLSRLFGKREREVE